MGTDKTDGDRTDRPRPADAVLTTCYRERLSSVYSTIEKDNVEVWRSKDERLVNDLLKKHRKPPERL